MFKSIDLHLELSIVGILILSAIVVLFFSFFPGALKEILDFMEDEIHKPILIALTIPVLAFAYAIGLIAETLSRCVFDRWHEHIKSKRMKKFILNNQALLFSNPFFRDNSKTETKDAKIKEGIYGELRFFVMMKSEQLYKEIAAQLNQLRVIRVLFIFLSLSLIALGVLSIRQPGSSPEIFIPLTVLTLIFWLANIWAINERFNRYCRAIERSYKTLLVDEKDIKIKRKKPRIHPLLRIDY